MRKYANILKEGEDEWMIAAKYNIEQHLGDVVEDPTDMAEIQRQAWQLAYDGAMDQGAIPDYAEQIADILANAY